MVKHTTWYHDIEPHRLGQFSENPKRAFNLPVIKSKFVIYKLERYEYQHQSIFLNINVYLLKCSNPLSLEHRNKQTKKGISFSLEGGWRRLISGLSIYIHCSQKLSKVLT